MKSVRILLCLIFLASGTLGYAQTNMVQGTVLNAETNETLPGSNVYIKELEIGTSANALGSFRFEELNSGTYTMEVSFVGFAKRSVQVQVQSGTNQKLQIALQPSSIQMEDVVVTQNLDQNSNTISAVDIQFRPINTSQDVLKIVPGLFIAQHAGGGKAEQIFLRGFDIDHGTDIELNVDGMPVNMVSHAHGQGYSDLHFVIPETIEQVDFDKGPYYAKQGNFNTAGYANFFTKRRLSESMFKIEGGQFGTFRTVGLFNLLKAQKAEDPSLYLATEFFRTDGYFESPQYFNRFNSLLKYHQKLNDTQTLELSFSGFTSSWDASGQIPQRAVDNGTITRFGAIDDTEGGETSRINLNSKLTTELSNGGYFENQVYFSQYNFNLVSNFTFFLNDPVNGDQITQSENRQIFGSKNSYWVENMLFGLPASTEVGIGFRYDKNNDVRLSRTLQRSEVLSDLAFGNVQEANIFAFAEEQVDLTKKLSLIAGLRFDQFTFDYRDKLSNTYDRESVNKSTVSPKLQIGYQANSNLNLYVKSGIGFHSNDTRVVVAQQGQEILPQAYGIDVGAIWKPTENLLINAALWRLDLDQEFVYVGDEGIVEPSGKTQRQGIDLTVRYQITDWLYFNSDVNFTDPKALNTAEGEDYIPLAPTFTSIGGFNFNFDSGFSGSLRYRYLDDRAANEDNSLTAEGYFLLDATLGYEIGRFQLGLSVENITDTEWNEAQFETESRLRNEVNPTSEIHFTPGTPFQARLSLAVKF
ncbi:TonB-dependent receptor [Roseivirga spongicola]|uniref:TonB-dependent receptor n=1 Tax=Roseivirga spongicola TaxID=333140 RepID=UPI002AC93DEC|nr:TonB-dependent receptor [Roseivirga spongicola]WPZ12158.1 TonB-dependent receptor [Roseivirga spongicola]